MDTVGVETITEPLTSESEPLLNVPCPDVPSSSTMSQNPMDDEDLDFQPKRVRQGFTQRDILLIQKHLKHYIVHNKSIIRKNFEEVVNNIPALAPLIKRIGVSSLITKVRTERKSL